jgi:hypothetical protein
MTVSGACAMSERESRVRSTLMTYFPMFIAILSLFTSIFNGYLNLLFVNLIERNIPRTEYMRTCKEVIDAYFQVKLRATVISRNRGKIGGGGGMTADQIEGANAVAKMGSLGTYLANLRNETIRGKYTEMNIALAKAVNAAATTPPEELDKLFAPADAIFADLNADCVKSALDKPM